MLPLSSMPRAAASRERGVSLLIVLVMLVIITLTSVAVMRGALSTDLVSNNARLQATATQAAQIGLRYCETEMVKDVASAAVTIRSVATPAYWTTFSNWATTGVTTVPTSYFAAATVAPVPGTRPQCVAEYSTVTGGQVVIVTSRGFSNDYTADSSGNTTRGSVVWLQSTVQLAAVSP